MGVGKVRYGFFFQRHKFVNLERLNNQGRNQYTNWRNYKDCDELTQTKIMDMNTRGMGQVVSCKLVCVQNRKCTLGRNFTALRHARPEFGSRYCQFFRFKIAEILTRGFFSSTFHMLSFQNVYALFT